VRVEGSNFLLIAAAPAGEVFSGRSPAFGLDSAQSEAFGVFDAVVVQSHGNLLSAPESPVMRPIFMKWKGRGLRMVAPGVCDMVIVSEIYNFARSGMERAGARKEAYTPETHTRHHGQIPQRKQSDGQ
jgi:hypothetical protein